MGPLYFLAAMMGSAETGKAYRRIIAPDASAILRGVIVAFSFGFRPWGWTQYLVGIRCKVNELFVWLRSNSLTQPPVVTALAVIVQTCLASCAPGAGGAKTSLHEKDPLRLFR